MLVGIRGKVKEIKENGILLEIPEGEIFIFNQNEDFLFDFGELELEIGDPIMALGIPIYNETEIPIFFIPTDIVNETRRKYIAPPIGYKKLAGSGKS